MEIIRAVSLNESEQSYQGAVELFEMRCRSLNLSPRTIEWYHDILKSLAVFLKSLLE